MMSLNQPISSTQSSSYSSSLGLAPFVSADNNSAAISSHVSPTSQSISNILAVPLQELQTLSQTLFHSLSPTQARPPPPPPIQAFLEIDARLAEAVKLARVHQIRQRRIEGLKDEVVRLEEGWRESVRELMEGKMQLEGVLVDAEERLKAIEEAKAGVSYEFSIQLPIDGLDNTNGLPQLLTYCSIYTLSRIACLCTKPLCVHFRAT
jgi:hypothetical protein